MRVGVIVLQMLWSCSALIVIAILRLPPGSWFPALCHLEPGQHTSRDHDENIRYLIFSPSLEPSCSSLCFICFTVVRLSLFRNIIISNLRSSRDISILCFVATHLKHDLRLKRKSMPAHVSAVPLGHSNKHSGDATDKAKDDWNEWDKEEARAGSWAFILLITNLFQSTWWPGPFLQIINWRF